MYEMWVSLMERVVSLRNTKGAINRIRSVTLRKGVLGCLTSIGSAGGFDEEGEVITIDINQMAKTTNQLQRLQGCTRGIRHHNPTLRFEYRPARLDHG